MGDREDEVAALSRRDAHGVHAGQLPERTLERRDSGDAAQPGDEQARRAGVGVGLAGIAIGIGIRTLALGGSEDRCGPFVDLAHVEALAGGDLGRGCGIGLQAIGGWRIEHVDGGRPVAAQVRGVRRLLGQGGQASWVVLGEEPLEEPLHVRLEGLDDGLDLADEPFDARRVALGLSGQVGLAGFDPALGLLADAGDLGLRPFADLGDVGIGALLELAGLGCGPPRDARDTRLGILAEASDRLFAARHGGLAHGLDEACNERVVAASGPRLAVAWIGGRTTASSPSAAVLRRRGSVDVGPAAASALGSGLGLRLVSIIALGSVLWHVGRGGTSSVVVVARPGEWKGPSPRSSLSTPFVASGLAGSRVAAGAESAASPSEARSAPHGSLNPRFCWLDIDRRFLGAW